MDISDVEQQRKTQFEQMKEIMRKRVCCAIHSNTFRNESK